MAQLSRLYMTTRKTTAVTKQTFVSKVMFLFFNTLSRFVIAALHFTLYLVFDFFFFILFLNFTILYWFCQILKWIRHRYTCVPHPEPSSLLPPHTIPLGRASNLDWRLVPYMILYVFQCHSPKSSHPLPLPQTSYFKVKVLVVLLCLTLCNPMDCSLCPWNSPGKNAGVGCHSFFQGIFPTLGLNLGFLNCRQILYCLSQYPHIMAFRVWL